MFIGSCLQTFRERQSVSSLRHLEDGTVDLKCPQVCETGRFCFSFHENQPLQCPGISLIYSTLPKALRAASCKAASYFEQEVLEVLESVCEIRFRFRSL